MRVRAIVSAWALLALRDVLAHGLVVTVAKSLTVLSVVVVHAMFMLVLLSVGARLQLEVIDVQVLNRGRRTFMALAWASL